MSLITRAEVENALERGSFEDVNLLGAACLKLLEVVNDLDPGLIVRAEQSSLLRKIRDLETRVSRRLHLENDGLVEDLEKLKAQFDELVSKHGAAPDLKPAPPEDPTRVKRDLALMVGGHPLATDTSPAAPAILGVTSLNAGPGNNDASGPVALPEAQNPPVLDAPEDEPPPAPPVVGVKIQAPEKTDEA